MIHFVDLGKQLAPLEDNPPRQFAFFNTVIDRFVTINGYQVFDSLSDLIMEMEADKFIDEEQYNRLLSLLPVWAQQDVDSGGQG